MKPPESSGAPASEFSRCTIAFGISLALACVVDALLVVAKEKIPAVMTGLQKLTGHHWISHSGIVLALFVAVGWLLAQGNGGRGLVLPARRLIGVVVAGVVIGSLIIFGFYLTELL